MWGGGARINTYVNEYLGAEAKKYGVTLNQVKLNATVDAVNKVLGEKQAGNSTKGAVDMIWINGENFATGRQAISGTVTGHQTSKCQICRLDKSSGK